MAIHPAEAERREREREDDAHGVERSRARLGWTRRCIPSSRRKTHNSIVCSTGNRPAFVDHGNADRNSKRFAENKGENQFNDT
ncbi:unnamed protein product [Jaminaea pallidilutea]